MNVILDALSTHEFDGLYLSIVSLMQFLPFSIAMRTCCLSSGHTDMHIKPTGVCLLMITVSCHILRLELARSLLPDCWMGFFLCLFPPLFKFLSCLDDDDDDLFYIYSFISCMGGVSRLCREIRGQSEGTGSFLLPCGCWGSNASQQLCSMGQPTNFHPSLWLLCCCHSFLHRASVFSPVSSLCGDSPLSNAALAYSGIVLCLELPTVHSDLYCICTDRVCVLGVFNLLRYSVPHTCCVNDLQKDYMPSWTCCLFETHHCG